MWVCVLVIPTAKWRIIVNDKDENEHKRLLNVTPKHKLK